MNHEKISKFAKKFNFITITLENQIIISSNFFTIHMYYDGRLLYNTKAENIANFPDFEEEYKNIKEFFYNTLEPLK